MKEPTFNGRELLLLSVMEATHTEDAITMERVLRYYRDYINKLCIRTLYGSNDILYVCMDGYMKHRLEVKLIHSVIAALRQRPGHDNGNVLSLSFCISAGSVVDVCALTNTSAGQWRRVIGCTDAFCLHRARRRVCHDAGFYESSRATTTQPQNKRSCLWAMTRRQDDDTPLQPQPKY